MEYITAVTNQMSFAISRTVKQDGGNVKMESGLYRRARCVMDMQTAMTNQIRIVQCVLFGTVVLGPNRMYSSRPVL